MLPLISIQILNWNRAEETQIAIQSALDQSYKNIEVVVIDNGSTDNSVELTHQNFPNIEIIKLDKNYGCPEGRNRGIKYCNGDFIFYLDNDGVLHKDAVLKAYNIIIEDDSIAVVAGLVYDFDDRKEIDTEVIPKSTLRYEFNKFAGGVCMHRKAIYDITGKYPSHFIYGSEEYFLSAKILDNNFKIIMDESIILWHKRIIANRDRTSELLNMYYNKLYVSLSLYPVIYAVLFLIYFPFKYFLYSVKNKMLLSFASSLLITFPKTIVKGLKYRDPIRITTYQNLTKTYPNSPI